MPTEAEIEAVARAIGEATVTLTDGKIRSLGYYAAVGADYFNHTDKMPPGALLTAAARAALEAAERMRGGSRPKSKSPRPKRRGLPKRKKKQPVNIMGNGTRNVSNYRKPDDA